MAALLKNVLISTSRAQANAEDGTDPESPNLVAQPAHAELSVMTTTDYRAMPPGILQVDLVYRVDPGVDIAAEDIITACTLLDGVTPWAQSATNGNETLRVALVQDGPPGLLDHRTVYVQRFTAGGMAY